MITSTLRLSLLASALTDEGTTTVTASCTDAVGSTMQTTFRVSVSLFPLGPEGLNPSIYKAGSFSTSTHGLTTGEDDFASPRLNPHWEWNHNPVGTAWSLTERAGWLRLKTSRVVSNLYLAPNTLTQRMQGPQCSATVRLDVSHLKRGDRAGFSAFNGQSGVLTVAKDGSRLLLQMSEQQVNFTGQELVVESVDEDIKESIDLSSVLKCAHTSTVYLRIDADFRLGRDIATFHYSTDGSTWTKIGSDFQMRFDWQRLFVGTRFALFCYATRQTGGYADFDAFDYTFAPAPAPPF